MTERNKNRNRLTGRMNAITNCLDQRQLKLLPDDKYNSRIEELGIPSKLQIRRLRWLLIVK